MLDDLLNAGKTRGEQAARFQLAGAALVESQGRLDARFQFLDQPLLELGVAGESQRARQAQDGLTADSGALSKLGRGKDPGSGVVGHQYTRRLLLRRRQLR